MPVKEKTKKPPRRSSHTPEREKKIKSRTDETKIKLKEALTLSLGNITRACESVRASRDTFYKYVKNDPDFANHVEECRERRIDFAEDKLNMLINEGNPTAILFLLKTLGKKRGYVEKQEAVS